LPFKITGSSQVSRNLRKLAARSSDAVMVALALEAELIMTDAKKTYVPVDLGTLRTSGIVDRPMRTGRDISVRMSFGGPAAAYALAVHEHLSVHSPPTWRGTAVKFSPGGRGPKYLSIPIQKRVHVLSKNVARIVKNLVRT
jgi:hypothetical protein